MDSVSVVDPAAVAGAVFALGVALSLVLAAVGGALLGWHARKAVGP